MLKDLQSEKDNRNIFISNIGICDYKLPISIKIGDKVYQSICNISSNVSLDETLRGAHLSRIIEVLNNGLYDKVITFNQFDKIVRETANRCETLGVHLNIDFDVIMKKVSPISKKDSYGTVNFEINNEFNKPEDSSLSISLLGTTLCPCSKEISEYGAHNQKCKTKITLFGDYYNAPIEKIIEVIESCFSSSVYSTVKREDEKYMTEKAYDNPKFSEDLIRDLLIGVSGVYEGDVVAEILNYESIHEHNVYAKGLIKK